MKKLLFVLLLVFVLILSMTLVACDSGLINDSSSDSDNTNNSNNNNSSKTITYYFDNKDISIEGLKIDFKCSESSYSNIKLTINLDVTNNNKQDAYFVISDLKLTNEKSNVNYDINDESYSSSKIQYQIKNSYYYSAIIPTSYKIENYRFQFKLNNNIYIIKLYETPDESRIDLTVNYVLSAYNAIGAPINSVKTETVKYGRKLSSLYVYEDSDYYCSSWYTDRDRTQKFSLSTEIYENLTLYGVKQSNIKYNVDQGEKWINGINHVPATGIIRINTDYTGQNVYLSNYGLYNNNAVVKIYLPKTLKRIYFGNFSNMSSLREIYFAGTQTEWEAIESSSTIPSTVRIIYNSSI